MPYRVKKGYENYSIFYKDGGGGGVVSSLLKDLPQKTLKSLYEAKHPRIEQYETEKPAKKPADNGETV